MNIEGFSERLERLLVHYSLTATALADTLGVQRSGISHLLSGRNKPSLEFVIKLDQAFPEVDLHWLLYGKGSFPKQEALPTAPSQAVPNPKELEVRTPSEKSGRSIERILVLYKDGSFSTYESATDT